jgi:hypothetical protein
LTELISTDVELQKNKRGEAALSELISTDVELQKMAETVSFDLPVSSTTPHPDDVNQIYPSVGAFETVTNIQHAS